MRKERIYTTYINDPKVGETYTIRDLKFTILEEFYKEFSTYKKLQYNIIFEKTGTKKEYGRQDIRIGKIEDYNRPTVCKNGIVGEDMQKEFYPVHNKPFYKYWHSMIIRCFSEYSINKREGICCEEWRYLRNFYDWWVQQKDNNIGYELDKDLICLAQNKDKIYSPTTCLFIPGELNGFFAGYSEKSNIYPIQNGWNVDMHYEGKRFRCNVDTYEEALILKKNKKREWLFKLNDKLHLENNLLNICLKILK